MRVLAFCRSDIDRQYAELLTEQLRGSAEITIQMLPTGGAAASSPYPQPPTRATPAEALRKLMSNARSAMSGATVLLPLRIAVLVRRFRRMAQEMEARIRDAAAEIVVLFEENVGDSTRLTGATAHRLGIPYVVLPTTIPNPREPERVYGAYRAHRVAGQLAQWAARRWPQWAREFDGRLTLRLPIGEIAALKWIGADSPTPWVLNSGQARAICVESRATRDIYQKLGVADEQLAVTGSPVDDKLHSAQRDHARLRNELMTRLTLDPDRLLVLVAFPPDQYAARSSEFEYPSFDALIDGWLKVLAPLASTVNIVVRPHPRLAPERLQVFEKAGCRVVTIPTEELVPLADVYVASISATIRWALALGIPVVNYDSYRYRYEDYDGAPGFLTVEDKGAFAAALQRICTDAAWRRGLRDKQLADASRWGCIDGQFSQRFLSVLGAIERSSTPLRPAA